MSTIFLTFAVELQHLCADPRGPVLTFENDTLSRAFMFKHDRTSGTMWPPGVIVHAQIYLHFAIKVW